jgi:hypothetical protein
MNATATPSGFKEVRGLVWLQEQPSRCPICHHGLQAQEHALELELPMQVVTGFITLHHCLHCLAPLSGVLRDLERLLAGADRAGDSQPMALFEIVDFCVDGCWLEVDVEPQIDQQTVPWAVYTQRLELQTELAESEAVRRRFLPEESGLPSSVDRSRSELQLDTEDT